MAYFWTQNDQSLSALVGLKILSRTDVQFFVHLWSVALPDFRGSIGYHCPPITLPSFRIHPFSDSASVRSPVLMLKFVHFFMFLFFQHFEWLNSNQLLLFACLPPMLMVKLFGFLEHFLFFHILGIIIPTDELIFFRGVETTNQYMDVSETG